MSAPARAPSPSALGLVVLAVLVVGAAAPRGAFSRCAEHDGAARAVQITSSTNSPLFLAEIASGAQRAQRQQSKHAPRF